MNSLRVARLESLIKQNLNTMVVTGEIRDPRVSGAIWISRVTLRGGGLSACVRVSSHEEKERVEKAIGGLKSAAGFIQGRLGRVLGTKRTPRLTFVAENNPL